MLFTEKGDLLSASRSYRELFLRDWRWSKEQDLCTDVYAPSSDYEWPKEAKCRKGDLPEHYQEEAKKYIRTITSRYPFQMRHYLGEPMWARFCDMWANTGDLVKAMRAI